MQTVWDLMPAAPNSHATISAVQPGHIFALALLIDHLPPRELAKGTLGTVCQKWLQVHREKAWRSMVLSAGNPESLYVDWEPTAAHTSVESFLSAPQELQARAAKSCESLKLIIADLDELVDHCDRWMQLRHGRLQNMYARG